MSDPTDDLPLPSPLVSLITSTLSDVAGTAFDAPRPTVGRNRLDDSGWRGVGPITPKYQRMANAALQLIEAFENGTAITKG
jgi:hypothetical protein